MNIAIKVTKSSDLCQVQGEHELPTTYTTNGEDHNIAEDFRGAKKKKSYYFPNNHNSVASYGIFDFGALLN